MKLDLVHDNYLLVLELCGCRGWCECEDCIGGEVVAESIDLGVLLANLAIAGALTRAFDLGWRSGWSPNIKGDPAP